MTNEEIDKRLKTLADYLPKHEAILRGKGYEKVERELELLNMSMMAVFAMLGEIAKRLPGGMASGHSETHKTHESHDVGQRSRGSSSSPESQRDAQGEEGPLGFRPYGSSGAI